MHSSIARLVAFLAGVGVLALIILGGWLHETAGDEFDPVRQSGAVWDGVTP